MKLAVLTACYKRYDIFRLFLNHLPKDITLICVGDEDENKQSFDESGIKGGYLIHENKPISNKWNAGLEFAKQYDFDYLIITGSDDLFSHDLWKWYKTLDVHYAGLLDFYFRDLAGKIKYNDGFRFNRKGEPHGAGRALHRSLLDAVGWRLWKDGLNEGLDASMTQTLRRIKFDYQFIRLKDKGFVAIDIKSSENIHSVSEYQGRWINEDESKFIYSKLG